MITLNYSIYDHSVIDMRDYGVVNYNDAIVGTGHPFFNLSMYHRGRHQWTES